MSTPVQGAVDQAATYYEMSLLYDITIYEDILERNGETALWESYTDEMMSKDKTLTRLGYFEVIYIIIYGSSLFDCRRIRR